MCTLAIGERPTDSKAMSRKAPVGGPAQVPCKQAAQLLLQQACPWPQGLTLGYVFYLTQQHS